MRAVVADALVVFADEIMEVAPNPTRARARTKLRIAMIFMVYFSLAVISVWRKISNFSLDKPDRHSIR